MLVAPVRDGAIGQLAEIFAQHQNVAAGGSILKPGTVLPFGYGGYFADPDGHPWEVCYNTDFPFSDDGRIVIP